MSERINPIAQKVKGSKLAEATLIYVEVRTKLLAGDLSVAEVEALTVAMARAQALASEVRQEIDELFARMAHVSREALLRKRLSDPAYTPSIDEACEDPGFFLDGFRPQ